MVSTLDIGAEVGLRIKEVTHIPTELPLFNTS